MLAQCSDCCAQDKGTQGGNKVDFAPPAPLDPGVHDSGYNYTNQDGQTQVVGEKADRARSTPLAERTDRKWVAVTAYQPIDTVTKTVEIPVIKTVETYVPKIVIEEKLVEVPKYIPEIVDKYVDVEEIHWVDKVVEVPQIQYKYKYVPKVEIRETTMTRNIPEVKTQERLVEVPFYRDITYLENNMINEKVSRVSDGVVFMDETKPRDDLRLDIDPQLSQLGAVQTASCMQQDDEDIEDDIIEMGPIRMCNMMQHNGDHANISRGGSMGQVPEGYMADQLHESGMRDALPGGIDHWQNENYSQDQLRAMALQQAGQPEGGLPNVNIMPETGIVPGDDLQHGNQPRIEQVFVPRVVQNVEIKKEVPVNVDVPVPYMVPKPMIVPVEVPVLKFHDHYKPVAVRRRVIPRIRWTNEVYEVECIRERPYVHVQDVIKPVPCDVEIGISEWVDRAVPINPCELSQADIHAMWMRANADLAEQKKHEYGEAYPSIHHPPGTVFGEPGQQENAQEGEPMSHRDENGAIIHHHDDRPTIPLHPGHPLNLPYLQNQWMKQDTTKTHQMYSPEWFEAHQRALHGVTTQNPAQVQVAPEMGTHMQEQVVHAHQIMNNGQHQIMNHEQQQQMHNDNMAHLQQQQNVAHLHQQQQQQHDMDQMQQQHDMDQLQQQQQQQHDMDQLQQQQQQDMDDQQQQQQDMDQMQQQDMDQMQQHGNMDHSQHNEDSHMDGSEMSHEQSPQDAQQNTQTLESDYNE